MRAEPGRIVARRTGRRAPLADQRGFLLVMVLVVMLVLSSVVASTLINSFLERSLAKNQNYASVALQAAEAGLAAGVTWVRENQASLPNPYTTDPNWTQTLTRNLGRDLNGDGILSEKEEQGGSYSVTLRFKREWRDVNGNGSCDDPGEDSGYKDGDPYDPGPDGVVATADDPPKPCPGDVVLYNKCSGSDGCFDFPDARYLTAAEAFPLIEIDSMGYFGADPASATSFREVVLDIARNKLNAVGVRGAITAKGSVEIKGTVDIYGENYDEAGLNPLPKAQCPDLPGAFVEAGESATSVGTFAKYSGNPPTQVNDGTKTIYTTPWEILGITEAEMPDPVTAAEAEARLVNPDYVGEIIYVQGDVTNIPNNSRGILVVHNAAGTANFSIAGTNKFTGLIIADAVKITGTSDIVGAVLSMSTTEVDVSAGTPKIKYSCDAIAGVTRQNYSTKIAWHRLR